MEKTGSICQPRLGEEEEPKTIKPHFGTKKGELVKAADEIRTHDVQLGKLADVNPKALKNKGLDGRGVGGVTKKVLSAREISDLVESCAEIPAHIKASIRGMLESAG